MERVNDSKYFSRIIRFVDFDILSGTATIMNGGFIRELSWNEQLELRRLIGKKGHAKRLSVNTIIVDRWICNAINNGTFIEFRN